MKRCLMIVLAMALLLVLTGCPWRYANMEFGFAREVSDRVLFIAEGNILESGAPDTFFRTPTHPRLQDFLRKVL